MQRLGPVLFVPRPGHPRRAVTERGERRHDGAAVPTRVHARGGVPVAVQAQLPRDPGARALLDGLHLEALTETSERGVAAGEHDLGC